MSKIAATLLLAALTQACVTTTSEAPRSDPQSRPTSGGMAVKADSPDGARLERRPCDPNRQEEQSGKKPRPQVEGGMQSDGRPYFAGGCTP